MMMMSFTFEENESVAAAIKRMAVEQIDLALHHLGDDSRNINESVHATRQSLKRIRALLALARDGLGGKVFAREWDCCRSAGRLLACGRDAAAAVDTFDALVGNLSDELAPDAFAAERRFLVERRETLLKSMIEEEGALQKAGEILSDARERVATWPVRHAGFDAIGGGLKRSYRSGRQGFRTVLYHPTPANFHEWRRPVKLLWHQLQILTPIWPEMMMTHSEELHSLSDQLNANHDLDVLRNILPRSPVEAESRGGRALGDFIDRRCRELEAKALPLGARLYTERSRHFADRLKGYWRTWQHEHRDIRPACDSMRAVAMPAALRSAPQAKAAELH
jgi:CHAD domain